MAIGEYGVCVSTEDDHDAGFHDGAPHPDCTTCQRWFCPLCAKKKPAHQPLCFACAASSAACDEAHRRGLIP